MSHAGAMRCRAVLVCVDAHEDAKLKPFATAADTDTLQRAYVAAFVLSASRAFCSLRSCGYKISLLSSLSGSSRKPFVEDVQRAVVQVCVHAICLVLTQSVCRCAQIPSRSSSCLCLSATGTSTDPSALIAMNSLSPAAIDPDPLLVCGDAQCKEKAPTGACPCDRSAAVQGLADWCQLLETLASAKAEHKVAIIDW